MQKDVTKYVTNNLCIAWKCRDHYRMPSCCALQGLDCMTEGNHNIYFNAVLSANTSNIPTREDMLSMKRQVNTSSLCPVCLAAKHFVILSHAKDRMRSFTYRRAFVKYSRRRLFPRWDTWYSFHEFCISSAIEFSNDWSTSFDWHKG